VPQPSTIAQGLIDTFRNHKCGQRNADGWNFLLLPLLTVSLPVDVDRLSDFILTAVSSQSRPHHGKTLSTTEVTFGRESGSHGASGFSVNSSLLRRGPAALRSAN
jgi:hypothetical protein